MTEVPEAGAWLSDTRDLQQLEYAVARILAETEWPVEVYAAVLKVIGETLGWQLGAAWEVGPQGDRLRCVRTWHAYEGAPEFEALSARIVLAPGEGFPAAIPSGLLAPADQPADAAKQ